MRTLFFIGIFSIITLTSCDEDTDLPGSFTHTIISIDSKITDPGDTLEIEGIEPIISIGFSKSLDTSSVAASIQITSLSDQSSLPFDFTYADGLLALHPTLKFDQLVEIQISNQLRGIEGDHFSPITFYLSVATGALQILEVKVDNQTLVGTRTNGISLNPEIKLIFSSGIDETISDHIKIFSTGKVHSFQLEVTDESSAVITLNEPLGYLNKHTINILDGYAFNGLELAPQKRYFYTKSDSTFKFPEISDDDLLTLVQQQTFKYFYDFAGPSSGMARERNTAGNTVTSGGSGFGVMSLVVGMERGFITRDQGLDRMEKILTFLEKADRFHGVYPHWMDDVTGNVIPFSTKDNGGDLVETSFLFQGLITFRQYMNTSSPKESAIIDRINTLWNEVEWDWHTRGGQNVLYWHWSPTYNWDINFALRGYYEAMITYVLAASSTTHTIPKEAYHEGWMRSGGVVNGKQFFGITLPLGYDYGGPLFFAHYSFLGLDPRNLQDQYANYWEQNVAHSLINYEHCIQNPRNHVGYNGVAWGLTASDQHDGYAAREPTNDNGTIAPTAALSSFPYTPEESMQALRYFYYIVGDRLWGNYGFYDAYNVNEGWWASSTLAIDQGPIIVMIENHRTGLLWDLFMSAPEVQTGLTKLEISTN